jgi:carbonic anhydrase
MEALAPAVEEARGQEGDLVENAVRANVRRVCAQLRESEPVLRPLVDEGRVQVYGVVYDLRSGRLTPLDGVP